MERSFSSLHTSTSYHSCSSLQRGARGRRFQIPQLKKPDDTQACLVQLQRFLFKPCKLKACSQNGGPGETAVFCSQLDTAQVTKTSSSLQQENCSKKLVASSQDQPDQPALAANSSVEDEGLPGLAESSSSSKATSWIASLASLGGIALLVGAGYVFRGQISAFLDFFINAVDEWGPLGYLAYAAVYTGLEVLAVPAIPLTMTAGVIFGPVPGTVVVSISGTIAATISFLIARYAARDKVLKWASKNPKFAAIDKAIGKDGFKFVLLLRLSPLLPLAASNYLYGLTSVDLGSYVLGSFLGMLPGTYAYVGAGHVGASVLQGGEGTLGVESWQVAVGLAVTLIAIGWVGRLAKKALDEVENEKPGAGNDKGS